MADWKYKLKNGKALRSAIDSEDYEAVLDALVDCWNELHRRFPDDYDEQDLNDDLDDIENERDNLENYEDYDMAFEDVEDNINYILNNLYDFCDYKRVWIEI